MGNTLKGELLLMEEGTRMPWRTDSVADQRQEFCVLANKRVIPFRELCARYGISPKTGYKWLSRYEQHGVEGLTDQSRVPLVSPRRTPPWVEELVCEIRRQHPSWGGRKIHNVLRRRGVEVVPAPSTITDILRRHGLLIGFDNGQRVWQRFEAEAPNRMWQMDFKGHFQTGTGRCDPFDVLDDHSRFSLCLDATDAPTKGTVKRLLTNTFDTYGLPDTILCDNGSPWGNNQPNSRWTSLGVWLIDVGVSLIHSRPYHPQTLGKDERFHRTLGLEVINRRHRWDSHHQLQLAFDQWRTVYNHQRPHDSLGGRVPADVYVSSLRSMPATITEPTYPDHYHIRKVDQNGKITYQGTTYRIGKGFRRQPIGLVAGINNTTHVYYRHQLIKTITIETS